MEFLTNLQWTELYHPFTDGWLFAIWGGYAEPVALSMRLLTEAVPIRVTVLLPESLN